MQPVETVASQLRTRPRATRWILPTALLLLAAAILGPPLISLNSVHRRIADSISQAIGRPVRMASIKMRLLPRPGFEIEDFVVDEDPGFGAEPILRSSQVVASVRLLPLWRGRLEIARIAFDEPSLNLARNARGEWNFDSLLSQAAQVPKAPTGERHPGTLPRFPYIEASDARINFKSGDEKLPFSFFNADLAVWLENPGEWRIEFAAQPVRTDLSLDLANTGTFKLEGTLRRAPTLHQMPMRLHAEWSNAPLGQLSKILTGSDADWRGQLNAAADIDGSVDNAALKLTAVGEGIHRAEFEPREPLNLNIVCQARFHRAGRLFDAVTCLSPAGDGHLLLTGSVHAAPEKPDPSLSLEINNVPVASALDGIRLFRSGFGNTVEATGAIDGNFTYAPSAATGEPEIEGQATVNRLTLAAPALRKPLSLPTLRLTMREPEPQRPGRGRAPTPSQPLPPQLLLEPFAVESSKLQLAGARDEPTPPSATKTLAAMTVSGAFDASGFSVHLGGEARVAEWLALGREFGAPRALAGDFGGQGSADLDLTVHGPWMLPVSDQPVAAASLDGTLRLRNAQLAASFLAQPVRVPAAEAVFADNRVEWTAASIAYGPVRGDLALSYPLACASPTGCVPRFTLRMATLDAATAQNALLGARSHGEIVQELLDRIRSLNQSGPSWPTLAGDVQIGTLTVGDLALRDVVADVSIAGRSIELKSASARALDGQLRLSGAMRIEGDSPRYQLQAQLDRASAAATAALFQEKWGPGSINLRTSLTFSGFEQQELLASATGTFSWEWNKGALPVADSATKGSNSAPVSAAAFAGLGRFDLWTAEGSIANRVLTLRKSQVVAGSRATPLAGTVSFTRELNLSGDEAPGAEAKTGSAAPAVKIGGTLARPH